MNHRLRHQQQGGGAFWYPSSSPPSPRPPVGYNFPPVAAERYHMLPPPHLAQHLPLHTAPPPYQHRQSYASQTPIPPLQHQQQHWFRPPRPLQQVPLPHHRLPYDDHPGLPPLYPQRQHHYPPPPHPYPLVPRTRPAYFPYNQSRWNPLWPQHQVWEYPDRNIHYGGEEDWAARARAWGAANSMTETCHVDSRFTQIWRMNEHEGAYYGPFPKAVGFAVDNQQLQLPHLSNQLLPICMMGPVTKLKSYYSTSSIYDQEVSYRFSCKPGNREAMGPRESLQVRFHSQFTAPVQMSLVEQPHFVPGNQSAKPSLDTLDQPLDFHPRFSFDPNQHKRFKYGHVSPEVAEGRLDQNITAAPVHVWSSSVAPVVGFSPIPLAPSGTQFDPAFASQPSIPAHPAPVFGGISVPDFLTPVSSVSTPFGLGVGTSFHASAFPGVANDAFNLSERPKKAGIFFRGYIHHSPNFKCTFLTGMLLLIIQAAVTKWLREEIIKKKSAFVSTNSVHSGAIEMEDADISFGRTAQADCQSIDSRSTEDEEDDEDGLEAARSATINLELKCVLTEVLLKVTDELFDEIATKVLNEDEPSLKASFEISP